MIKEKKDIHPNLQKLAENWLFGILTNVFEDIKIPLLDLIYGIYMRFDFEEFLLGHTELGIETLKEAFEEISKRNMEKFKNDN